MSDDELIDVPIESLPLDGWHRARGARMVEFAGYHMPIQYEGIMAEHLWTRESAGLFDVSHMGQLLFTSDSVDVAAAPRHRVAHELEKRKIGEPDGVGGENEEGSVVRKQSPAQAHHRRAPPPPR